MPTLHPWNYLSFLIGFINPNRAYCFDPVHTLQRFLGSRANPTWCLRWMGIFLLLKPHRLRYFLKIIDLYHLLVYTCNIGIYHLYFIYDLAFFCTPDLPSFLLWPIDKSDPFFISQQASILAILAWPPLANSAKLLSKKLFLNKYVISNWSCGFYLYNTKFKRAFP